MAINRLLSDTKMFGLFWDLISGLQLNNTYLIGLEVLLNVDQRGNVPFVTSSSGAVIAPLYNIGEYLDANSLVYVPPGFQANIAVSKVLFLLY